MPHSAIAFVALFRIFPSLNYSLRSLNVWAKFNTADKRKDRKNLGFYPRPPPSHSNSFPVPYEKHSCNMNMFLMQFFRTIIIMQHTVKNRSFSDWQQQHQPKKKRM